MAEIIELTHQRQKSNLNAVLEQCREIEDDAMEIDGIVNRLLSSGRITAAQKLIEAQQILQAESAFLWAHANGQDTSEITKLFSGVYHE